MAYTSTILIIDDEPSARDSLEVLLSPQGYELAFAANGEEGLQRAAALAPDLILLDVMMPGMDGFEVCRRLRATPHLAEVPIVMVTALDDRPSRLRGIEAGADDFVSKPFNRAELRARVRTITRLNRYRRLHAERNRFEWVVSQSSDGYLVVSEGGRVLYANPQARAFLELPQDEQQSIPDSFLELAGRRYHCEPQDAWANWPEAAQQARLYLVQPESPTAKPLWLQVDVFDLPAGGDLERLVRLRDATAQMSLRHEVWGFHAAISHKLRTPLVILLNSLELQARHMADFSEAQRGEMSAMALSSVNRLRGSVGDVLQYLNAPALAKPGEGFELSRLPALATEISAYLKIKSMTVRVEDDLAEARMALSERGLELSLWEILENAVKFHPSHSPQVEIHASLSASNRACLQVCDDGLTLSSAQLAQAWTPYYQGEKYLTGEVDGMGLGLAMVASLVWRVGGTCRMYNRGNRAGIVVELVLPLAMDDDELPTEQ
jgi:two-component system cell cycle response regulator